MNTDTRPDPISPPAPATEVRPADVPTPLACADCGRSTPLEGAEHPDDGSAWHPGWPGRVCGLCMALRRVAPSPYVLRVAQLAEAIGEQLDVNDPAVAEVLDSVVYASRFTGRFDVGNAERWQHVDTPALQAALRRERERRLDAITPKPAPDGRGCAACGVRRALDWVSVADWASWRWICPPCQADQQPPAQLGDALGATWADRLVARAARAHNLPAAAIELGFQMYADLDPAGPGHSEPFAYLGEDLDRLRDYVRRTWPDTLIDATQRAAAVADYEARHATHTAPAAQPGRLTLPGENPR